MLRLYLLHLPSGSSSLSTLRCSWATPPTFRVQQSADTNMFLGNSTYLQGRAVCRHRDIVEQLYLPSGSSSLWQPRFLEQLYLPSGSSSLSTPRCCWATLPTFRIQQSVNTEMFLSNSTYLQGPAVCRHQHVLGQLYLPSGSSSLSTPGYCWATLPTFRVQQPVATEISWATLPSFRIQQSVNTEMLLSNSTYLQDPAVCQHGDVVEQLYLPSGSSSLSTPRCCWATLPTFRVQQPVDTEISWATLPSFRIQQSVNTEMLSNSTYLQGPAVCGHHDVLEQLFQQSVDAKMFLSNSTYLQQSVDAEMFLSNSTYLQGPAVCWRRDVLEQLYVPSGSSSLLTPRCSWATLPTSGSSSLLTQRCSWATLPTFRVEQSVNTEMFLSNSTYLQGPAVCQRRDVLEQFWRHVLGSLHYFWVTRHCNWTTLVWN